MIEVRLQMSELGVGAATENTVLEFVVCLKEGQPSIYSAVPKEMKVTPAEGCGTANVNSDAIRIVN